MQSGLRWRLDQSEDFLLQVKALVWELDLGGEPVARAWGGVLDGVMDVLKRQAPDLVPFVHPLGPFQFTD